MGMINVSRTKQETPTVYWLCHYADLMDALEAVGWMTGAMSNDAAKEATKLLQHAQETQNRIITALGTLPRDDGQIMRMKFIDSMKAQDIADMLHYTKGNINRRISIALACIDYADRMEHRKLCKLDRDMMEYAAEL